MDILAEIKQPIRQELDLLNRALAQELASTNQLLNSVVDYYLSTKGKQMRPILVLLAARLFGEIRKETIDAALSIELLHNASLIHDDVVDATFQRRGKESVNAIWDNRIAVLVGDFFVSTALKCSLSTNDIEIVSTLSQLGRDLAWGEIEQLDNARRKILSEEAYFEVINKKTASLFVACMKVGARSSGKSDERIKHILSFGEKLGMCFQIKDDIFDYFNDPAIGKPTGNDIREGKVTLPLIYALSQTDDATRKHYTDLLEKVHLTNDEIHSLIEFAKANGGIDYAEKVMYRFRDEALQTIEIFKELPAYLSLKNILQYTIERKK